MLIFHLFERPLFSLQVQDQEFLSNIQVFVEFTKNLSENIKGLKKNCTKRLFLRQYSLWA